MIQSHGIEHYHQAALVLLEERGGSFRLGDVYYEFYEKIRDLLKSEDYHAFKSGSEPRWRTRFRLALWHMRNDGRGKYYGYEQYEITERGREYLRTTFLPLQILTEEIEDLDDGGMIVRCVLPDGTVSFEFRVAGEVGPVDITEVG